MRTAPQRSSRLSAEDRILTFPNALSLARLASVPVFVWLFLTDRENAAFILYGIGAFTDFLDGYVARVMRSATRLGALLDPLADRAVIVALAVALVARGSLPLWLAIAIVGRDALVLSVFPALDRHGIERIPVSFTGKTATASLLFGLSWLALSETTFGLSEVGDEVGMTFTVLGAVFYWVATWMYGRQVLTRLRAREEG